MAFFGKWAGHAMLGGRFVISTHIAPEKVLEYPINRYAMK